MTVIDRKMRSDSRCWTSSRSLRPAADLERDDGWSGPAVPASSFFEPYEAWPAWERRTIDLIEGSVLDLDAGAGVTRSTWDAFLRPCPPWGSPGLGGDAALLRRLAGMASQDAILIETRSTPRATIRTTSPTSAATRRPDRIEVTSVFACATAERPRPGGGSSTSRPEDVDGLVRGTGWQFELHERDGEDHVVVLRRAEGGDVG